MLYCNSMTYRTLLEQRRKRLEKAEKAFDALSDVEVQAQLAADPEMRAAFVAAIQGTNGNAPPTVNAIAGGARLSATVPPPGSLLRAVLDAAKLESGDFTVATLVAHMEKGGYSFAAQDAKVAAGSVLKDLAGRGLIRVVSLGKGRRATVYRVPKEETKE
jgi:hypothetical protein